MCVYSAGAHAGPPFSCAAQPLQHTAHTPTPRHVFACSGAYVQSGYQPTSDPSYVCGCADWDIPTEHKCYSSNSEWTNIALPWVSLIKDICPVAYSYAYDDMTSTFVCGGGEELGYVVEFCPNGVELSA